MQVRHFLAPAGEGRNDGVMTAAGADKPEAAARAAAATVRTAGSVLSG